MSLEDDYNYFPDQEIGDNVKIKGVSHKEKKANRLTRIKKKVVKVIRKDNNDDMD